MSQQSSLTQSAHSVRQVLTAYKLTPVWFGRAVQEVFVDQVAAVLRYCIRPLIGASVPGHHGYQRAYDLILGQASNGLVPRRRGFDGLIVSEQGGQMLWRDEDFDAARYAGLASDEACAFQG